MDNSIKIYDLYQSENDTLCATLKIDSNKMNPIQTEENQPYDASGDVEMNQIQSGAEQSMIDPAKLCFNPKNSGQLITGTLALQVVDTDFLNNRLNLQYSVGHNKYINCVHFAPQGTMMVTGDIDGAVKVFDVNTKEQKGKSYKNHGRGVKTVKFNPSGTHLISGSEDLHIHMSDIETQQRVSTYVNHANWVTCLAFNPA